MPTPALSAPFALPAHDMPEDTPHTPAAVEKLLEAWSAFEADLAGDGVIAFPVKTVCPAVYALCDAAVAWGTGPNGLTIEAHHHLWAPVAALVARCCKYFDGVWRDEATAYGLPYPFRDEDEVNDRLEIVFGMYRHCIGTIAKAQPNPEPIYDDIFELHRQEVPHDQIVRMWSLPYEAAVQEVLLGKRKHPTTSPEAASLQADRKRQALSFVATVRPWANVRKQLWAADAVVEVEVEMPLTIGNCYEMGLTEEEAAERTGEPLAAVKMAYERRRTPDDVHEARKAQEELAVRERARKEFRKPAG